MKKLLILIILLTAFACQKDDSGSLEYTTWTGNNVDAIKRSVNFQSNNKCTDYLYIKPSPPYYVAYELSYEVTGNTVKLIQATGTYATGVISGNTLTMDYGYEDAIWVMTKQ